jgi:hypothetical protein
MAAVGSACVSFYGTCNRLGSSSLVVSRLSRSMRAIHGVISSNVLDTHGVHGCGSGFRGIWGGHQGPS